MPRRSLYKRLYEPFRDKRLSGSISPYSYYVRVRHRQLKFGGNLLDNHISNKKSTPDTLPKKCSGLVLESVRKPSRHNGHLSHMNRERNYRVNCPRRIFHKQYYISIGIIRYGAILMFR